MMKEKESLFQVSLDTNVLQKIKVFASVLVIIPIAISFEEGLYFDTRTYI